MDPPSYGRGANGEVWKFEENLPMLIEICMQVLSDNPLFFLINSYTTGTSSMVLENLLKMNMSHTICIAKAALSATLRMSDGAKRGTSAFIMYL